MSLNINKLYASRRTYKKKILDHWVFFQPDHYGLPVVVDELLFKIYTFFKYGALTEEAVKIFSTYEKFDPEEIRACIEFLIDNGFLRTSIEPKLYTTYDFVDISRTDYLEVWLHITNNCNLKCDYCFVKNKDNSVMSNDTIEKIIASLLATSEYYPAIKNITIKFTGGEPTLVLDKIKHFQSHVKRIFAESEVKINYSILSNGTLITAQLVETMKENKLGIGISIDGFGVIGHDKYRRFKTDNSGSWDIVNNNIKNLIKNNINPYIMATISKDSCSTLQELVAWIFNQGLRARLSVVRQFSGSKWTNNKREYKKYSEVLIDNFDLAFRELEKHCYEIDFSKGNPLNICELGFAAPSYTSCCGIGTSHLVINTNGSLTCCPMCINETSIEPSDDLLSSIRKTFSHSPTERNRTATGKACLACQWYPVCVGGCPITNKRIFGNPFEKSPLHEFYKYVIPRYIEFYGKKLIQNAKRLGINNFHVIKT